MSMTKFERYPGTDSIFIKESVDLGSPSIPSQNQAAVIEALGRSDRQVKGLLPNTIYPLVHCLRAESLTRNFTFYPVASLTGDVEEMTGFTSWKLPYPTPWLKEHSASGGLFGPTQEVEVYGRTVEAFWTTNAEHTKGVVGAIPAITDPYAIERVLDGRFKTVSVGISADEAWCSICGANIVKEPCDHERKSRYGENEDLCFIKVGPIRNKETSFVAIPSDVGAMVKDVDVDQETMAIYAGNPVQEYMCDLRDPNRRNLLESDDKYMATLAGQLLEESKEFYEFYHRPKTYFITDGGRGEMEEKKLTTKARKSLPDSAFALVYVDKKTGNKVRRFPIHDRSHAAAALRMLPKAKNLTSAQRAMIRRKAQAKLNKFKKKGKKEHASTFTWNDEKQYLEVVHMGWVEDEEVEKLLEGFSPAESEEDDEDSPVVIEIDGENYPLLYHVIEELEAELERADQVIAEKDEIISKLKDQLEGKEDEVEEKDDDTETRSESSDEPDKGVKETADDSSDDETGESEKDIDESDDDKSKEKEESADDDSSDSDESAEEGSEEHEERSSDSEEDSQDTEEGDTEDREEGDDSAAGGTDSGSAEDLSAQRQGIDSAYQAAVKGLTGERDELKDALAEAVATLMVQARPAARGKSIEELVEKLKQRTSESLRDTLRDLKEELESSDGAVVDKDRVETVTDEHEDDVPVVEDNDPNQEPKAPKLVGSEKDFWSDVQEGCAEDVQDMVNRLKQA
jgi:hypothetical protein